ncbi:MAG TPA: DnaJ domain-containing protein, partial [Ktedonobacterales bacterium]
MPISSRPDPLGGERFGERIGLSDDFAEAHDEPTEDDDSDEPGLPDLYARLGASPSATPDDLRRAYHRLVKLWHPDRYVGAPDLLRARAERRMRQLNAAYDTLSDPQARAEYDAQREGHGVPVGDVINVFGQRAAAQISHAEHIPDGHASANPNGAGQFFGMLAA